MIVDILHYATLSPHVEWSDMYSGLCLDGIGLILQELWPNLSLVMWIKWEWIKFECRMNVE